MILIDIGEHGLGIGLYVHTHNGLFYGSQVDQVLFICMR